MITPVLPVLLASGSPRRREILLRFIKDFETFRPETDETIYPDKDLDAELMRVTRLKASSGRDSYPRRLILAFDTVAVKDGEVLGKPKDVQDAVKMLRLLSDSSHEVRTCAVYITPDGEETAWVEKSRVYFHELKQELIESYVITDEPFGKAGAYAAQGLGALFIKRLEGDFYNVVGLPVSRLMRELLDKRLCVLRHPLALAPVKPVKCSRQDTVL